MDRNLNREVLDALLTVATSDRRWENRSRFASEAGLSPATLTNALSGRRGMSADAIGKVADTLGVRPEALTVPGVAVPGDLRTKDIEQALARISHEFTRALNDVRDEVRAWQSSGPRRKGD